MTAQVVETPALDAALRARLDAAFGATTILSPASFRFADLPPVELPPASAVTEAQMLALANSLAIVLYNQCYTHDYRGGSAAASLAPSGTADPGFAARVAAVNTTQQRWDPHWCVYQLGTNGAVHVQKGDSYLLAQPGRFAFAQAAMRAPAVGDAVEIFVPRDDAGTTQLGFYYVFGDTVASEFDEAELARFYFHATPDGVAPLVAALSEKLNRYAVPFRLKFLSDGAWYQRTDPVVLYLSRRFLEPALSIVATARAAFAAGLRPAVPLFAKALADGIGAADDPGTGESFGQSRCALTARGIVDAWLRGSQSPQDRLQAVAQRFAAAGLSLERPHVGAGLVDLYVLPAGWGT